MEQTRLAWGRGRVTGNDEDIGAYKVPTLRNIMVTAPYMHDGRLESIRAVFEHYRFGVQETPTLDVRLRARRFISEEEVLQMIAFLEALTDERFLTEPLWGPPL